MKRNLTITVATGEASGERHSVKLIEAIKDIIPHSRILGMGSGAMREVGCEVVVDTASSGVLGLTEVIPRLRYFRDAYREMKRVIDESDILIVVDNFGFNLLLIRYAKRVGLPVFYLIPPKVWAWGLWRGHLLARYTDRVYTHFPFEVDILSGLGCQARFFGVPLYSYEGTAPVNRKPDNERVIALLPGSREMEVKALLPVILSACETVIMRARVNDMPPLRLVVSRASTIDIGLIEDYVEKSGLDIAINDGISVLDRADLTVVASGTATLEALLRRVPMVVVYKVSPLTWAVGKALARVKHISLPNILAGVEIVPEVLQGDLRPQRLAYEMLNLMMDEERCDVMRGEYEKIIEVLSPNGDIVYKRIADDIIDYLERPI